MRTAARPGYLLAMYRCLHRPSRRAPHPTLPDCERCTSCGATFPNSKE